jgi:hypothetical protein
MKRTSLVLAALLVVVALAGAQDGAQGLLVKRLGVTEKQAAAFLAIYADSAADLARARAEVNVQKALLARLLLDADANEREVEKILRQAVEAEVQVRMIQVRRELAARRLLGDRRWLQLRELLRRQAALRARAAADAEERTAREPELDAKERALLDELVDLLGE